MIDPSWHEDDEDSLTPTRKNGFAPTTDGPLLASSGDWSSAFGIRVLDPDGWDRVGSFEASWSELIDVDEFQRRVARSTVDSRTGRTLDEARAWLRGVRMGR